MKHKLIDLGRQAFSEDETIRRRSLIQLLFLGFCFLLMVLIIATTSLKGIKRGILASKNFMENRQTDWELSPTCYEKSTGISHCYKPGEKN